MSVITAALLAAGCSSAGSDRPPRPPLPAKNFNEADPATWTLPIEAYLPTDEEEKQIGRARNAVIADCMKEFGFQWRPAPELPKVGSKTLTDWRYGLHDAARAKSRGYKPDAAEQAAYDTVMKQGAVRGDAGSQAEEKALKGTVDEMGGKAVPKGGCSGKAVQRVASPDAVYSRTAQDISHDAYRRAQKDPAVAEVFGKWSACMKESGYSYKEPLDTVDDPRFKTAEPSDLEISTAAADLACRGRFNVAKAWFDAEVKLQDTDIDKHAEELDEARKALDAAVRNAANVLAGTR
ncbi:hypothetical protein [Streptomyces sp. NPDC021096]|uniref:hypothetical protein n=1 Tax=Streptomyces sp. NPDC021096 TaxID=3154792 RepID=UPI0033E76F33